MENNIDEKMPDKLYKYMPWRWVKDEKGNNRNYARELIENNEFYLQSPKNFNDPFDSKVYPSVKIKGTKQTLQRIEKLYRNNGKELGRREKRNLKDNPQAIAEYRERVISAAKHVSDKTGVCCFTETPGNILMWSHYADSHQGICLIFSGINNPVFKVSYEKKYPNIDYATASTDNWVRIQFLTKAEDWRYEKEYRIFKSGFAHKTIKFEPNSLIGIICGCCITDEHIKEIRAVLKERSTPVTLYKAEKNKYQFGLNVDKVIGRYGGGK